MLSQQKHQTARILLVLLTLFWYTPTLSFAAAADENQVQKQAATAHEQKKQAELAETLENAITAFQAGDFFEAQVHFEQIQATWPDHAATAYYLGLLTLRRHDTVATIRHWQRLLRVDPEAAESRAIPRRLTLLQNKQRDKEMVMLIENETTLSKRPPETGSIAVAPLHNRGEKKYDVLAKGLTALIIADLAKVPGIRVLERGKIQKLLDEIKLSKTGLVAKETQLRTGRLLKAEKLISGDFSIR